MQPASGVDGIQVFDLTHGIPHCAVVDDRDL
jgi:hypothetical protein